MKFSKYQDTPQRAQSPSLFPVAFLSARISFSISSHLSFLLRTPQHCHELASPWLIGCVPLPGGGSLQTVIYLCSKATSQLPSSWQSHIVTELINFIQPYLPSCWLYILLGSPNRLSNLHQSPYVPSQPAPPLVPAVWSQQHNLL